MKFIRWIGPVLLFCFAGLGRAQEYQAAKSPLVGQCIQKQNLLAEPKMDASILGGYRSGQKVLITGKQGDWFEIYTSNGKGWLLSNQVKVIEVYRGKMPKPKQTQKAPRKKKSIPVQDRSPKTPRKKVDQPFSLGLTGYSAFAGKSFYNHLRSGLDGCYYVGPDGCVGFLVEGIFIRGQYLQLGPTFRYHFPHNQFNLFTPRVHVGLMYYSFDHSGDDGNSVGAHLALEASRQVMSLGKHPLFINAKVGADIMFFMVDQVRIPVGGGFSLLTRF
ncbi:MAG: SH3 domain-containing protein [Bdellovibrionota bacterium]